MHAHVPLVGEEGLDHGTGTVAAWHHQLVVLDLFQQIQGIQILDDLFARLEAVHADVRLGDEVVFFGIIFTNRGIAGEDIDQPAVRLFADGVLVTVTQPDLVVVEVVSRGDFYTAGAEFRVDVFIGNNRDLAPGKGQFHELAQQMLVAFVARVDGNRAITEQGFGTGGRYHQLTGAVGERIAHMPQVAIFFLGQYLQVGYGGVQHRVPVDQPLAAVDQAFLVQAHEDFLHRIGQAFVHGEALVLPVQRATHAPQLSGNVSAGGFFPFPHTLDKRLAAEVVARPALRFQPALHHHLGGDTGVVAARLPQGVVAAHAMKARQRIHQCVLEGVPHVQVAGDIRRRDHDAIGLALATRGEIAPLFPGLVPALFDAMGVVGFFHNEWGLYRTNAGRPLRFIAVWTVRRVWRSVPAAPVAAGCGCPGRVWVRSARLRPV